MTSSAMTPSAGCFANATPKPFDVCFVRFMERFAQGLDGVIAVDGKTLRGSFDRASDQSPLHMVDAWAVDQRLLLWSGGDRQDGSHAPDPRQDQHGDIVLYQPPKTLTHDQASMGLRPKPQPDSRALPRDGRAPGPHNIEMDGFPKALGLWRVQGRALALAFSIGQSLEGLVLLAEHAVFSTAVHRSGAGAIWYRERTALGPGRDDERGPQAQLEGSWAGKHGASMPDGPQLGSVGGLQGIDIGKA